MENGDGNEILACCYSYLNHVFSWRVCLVHSVEQKNSITLLFICDNYSKCILMPICYLKLYEIYMCYQGLLRHIFYRKKKNVTFIVLLQGNIKQYVYLTYDASCNFWCSTCITVFSTNFSNAFSTHLLQTNFTQIFRKMFRHC